MFKVGDWVKINEYEEEVSTHKLDEDMLYLVKQFYKDYTKLWKPKEGEWVVRTQVNGKAGVSISGFDVLMWTNEDVYECEPFIGELPSFLKDK